MKSPEQSQSFIDYTSKIESSISEDTDFHLALKEEYSSLHKVLEEEGMELGDFMSLKYSRRPSLLNSYLESLQIPAIITDKRNLFLGVISLISIFQKGQKKNVSYTSDLRISKKAGIRIRINFRKMYINVLNQLGMECYTVVLKENQKAINALTKNKADLYYHPIYEYTSSSVLILPSVRLLSSNLRGLSIVQGRDQDFEKKKRKNSPFAHGSSDDDLYFLIKNRNKTVGSFSLTRPKNRSLRVEAKNGHVRFWVKFANKLFSHNYEEKLPWVYMTSFFLDEDIDQSQCIKEVLKFLYKTKKIRSGEIFLFCHASNLPLEQNLMTPQFNTNGILYKVSTTNDKCDTLSAPVYLNPICL